MDHCLVMVKGLASLNEAMSHGIQSHQRWTWSTGGGDGKALQYPCPENPMNSMKRQKDRTPGDEPPGQKVSDMLLGTSRGQLTRAP